MEFESFTVRAGTLSIAVEVSGPADGWPVVLLHGFPYDPRSYDDVASRLVAAGARVVAPYLRGFGLTRFLAASTLHSGQQAAIGHDVLQLINALALEKPLLVGFDWGGRAACIAAALWPERVGGLVAIGGYEVQNIAEYSTPEPPLEESRMWYQYYFHGERGRAGLSKYRRELAAKLWQDWAPGRQFSADEFARSAASFDSPDFVDVVIHSYRHRSGLAEGDPEYEQLERALAHQPAITVPTVVLDPTEDPMVEAQTTEAHLAKFPNLIDHRFVPSGHNMPHDEPEAVAAAVLALHDYNAKQRVG